MNWADVGKSILSVAPTLAACLGGPAGVIAGGAIKVITSFLNLGPDATAQQAADELAKLTGDQFVALRTADGQYKQHMLDAGVDLERIAAGDRDSARKMRVDSHDFITDALAAFLTVGFFGMLALMWFRPPPPESKDLLNIMLGALGSAWTTAMAFFFGSSSGSDKLKAILSNVTG